MTADGNIVRGPFAVMQPAASAAIVPAPTATVARRQWGADFAAKLMGTSSEAQAAAPGAPTVLTYATAAGLAALDGVELGILGLLAGAAHKRGLLNPSVAGVVGLLALAASAPASVHSPLAGRAIGNVGLAGIFAAAFTAGERLDAEKEPSPRAKSPAGLRGEDPIAAAEREANLL